MAIKTRFGETSIVIKTGDITRETVDAIVNAANSRLLGGGGVDGAIHSAAGPSLLEECMAIGYCHPGEAVVTGGGRLHAKYVIHTVGPVWRGGTVNEERVLASAFKQSLKRAQEKGVKTIAFPAISTGAYGFPADLAAKVSLCAVKEYLAEQPDIFDEIRLVLFNQRVYEAFEKAFLECFGPA